MGQITRQPRGRDHTLIAVLGDEVISSRLVRADRVLARMRGLLGRRSLDQGEGLWITPCNSIHMLFMRFPIDVVFLDEQHQVVRLHEHVEPWRIARGGRRARSVLELPVGTIARSGLGVGARLRIAPQPSTSG